MHVRLGSGAVTQLKVKYLLLLVIFSHVGVNSPGLTPALACSSSSNAANTADLAKMPDRVVDGSLKSMLQNKEEKKNILNANLQDCDPYL
jgi:hypothetical protein